MLALYRSLLAARRSNDALSIGEFLLVETEADVLAYERRYDGARFLIALNFGSERRRLPLPAGVDIAETLVSTLALRQLDGTLAPDEGLILRLSGRR
jgi:oligo-1,6-glucosidase/alpha-glucosidase